MDLHATHLVGFMLTFLFLTPYMLAKPEMLGDAMVEIKQECTVLYLLLVCLVSGLLSWFWLFSLIIYINYKLIVRYVK